MASNTRFEAAAKYQQAIEAGIKSTMEMEALKTAAEEAQSRLQEEKQRLEEDRAQAELKKAQRQQYISHIEQVLNTVRTLSTTENLAPEIKHCIEKVMDTAREEPVADLKERLHVTESYIGITKARNEAFSQEIKYLKEQVAQNHMACADHKVALNQYKIQSEAWEIERQNIADEREEQKLLNQERKHREDKYKKLLGQNKSLDENIQKLTEQNEEVKKELQDLTHTYGELIQSEHVKEEQIFELNKQLHDSAEQRSEAKRELQKLTRTNEEAARRVNAKDEKISTLQEQLQQLQVEASEQRKREETTTESISSQLKLANSELDNLRKSSHEDIAKNQQRVQELELSHEQLRTDLTTSFEKEKRLQTTLAESIDKQRQRSDELESELAEERQQHAESKAELNAMEINTEKLRDSLTQDLEERKSQLENLQLALNMERERYSVLSLNSTIAIEQNSVEKRSQDSRIAELLADLEQEKGTSRSLQLQINTERIRSEQLQLDFRTRSKAYDSKLERHKADVMALETSLTTERTSFATLQNQLTTDKERSAALECNFKIESEKMDSRHREQEDNITKLEETLSEKEFESRQLRSTLDEQKVEMVQLENLHLEKLKVAKDCSIALSSELGEMKRLLDSDKADMYALAGLIPSGGMEPLRRFGITPTAVELPDSTGITAPSIVCSEDLALVSPSSLDLTTALEHIRCLAWHLDHLESRPIRQNMEKLFRLWNACEQKKFTHNTLQHIYLALRDLSTKLFKHIASEHLPPIAAWLALRMEYSLLLMGEMPMQSTILEDIDNGNVDVGRLSYLVRCGVLQIRSILGRRASEFDLKSLCPMSMVVENGQASDGRKIYCRRGGDMHVFILNVMEGNTVVLALHGEGDARLTIAEGYLAFKQTRRGVYLVVEGLEYAVEGDVVGTCMWALSL
ncbi:MAG: hypothetical protein M1834_009454 [Cirrosporium novae-zelandiae]|nr:MAG: hypothetical protein M1834_009454 [Cirrosporium novae-zelandiae]